MNTNIPLKKKTSAAHSSKTSGIRTQRAFDVLAFFGGRAKWYRFNNLWQCEGISSQAKRRGGLRNDGSREGRDHLTVMKYQPTTKENFPFENWRVDATYIPIVMYYNPINKFKEYLHRHVNKHLRIEVRSRALFTYARNIVMLRGWGVIFGQQILLEQILQAIIFVNISSQNTLLTRRVNTRKTFGMQERRGFLKTHLASCRLKTT